MTTTGQKRLTRLVKRFLDIAWFILLSAVIIWPIVSVAVGSNLLPWATSPGGGRFFDPEVRDVTVYLGFEIRPDSPEAATVSGKEPLIRGRSEVQVNTPSLFAWYLAAIIEEVGILIVLYGLMHLRKLFASLVEDESFSNENAKRIKIIGFVLIGWHAVIPLMQYFGGRAILSDIELSVRGIQLSPGYDLSLSGFVFGLAIIVLSAVLREAANLHQDQSLTI